MRGDATMSKKSVDLDQDWKDFYDHMAQEAVETSPAAILGTISAIIAPDYGRTNAQKIARIRYLMTAYDKAFEANLNRLREERRA
jgi:hypothetical protein